ncbi:MAG: 3-keto-5-aminohexanoate cleavage protein [Pikeienuella sp.]
MLQACLNGARTYTAHPALPLTAAEVAADAISVRHSGATALHIHPRGANGAESLEAADVAATLNAVRRATPAMPVGIATGAWIEPNVERRLACLRSWTTLPDYASVNISEQGSFDVMNTLLHIGVGIEAGIWNEVDAERFVTYPHRHSVLRVLIETQADNGADATATYHAVRQTLKAAGVTAPLLLHGEGGSVWPMIHLAHAEGLDTRVGLEDGLHLPDGTLATDNAAVVTAAHRILFDKD